MYSPTKFWARRYRTPFPTDINLSGRINTYNMMTYEEYIVANEGATMDDYLAYVDELIQDQYDAYYGGDL
jgi:hypothetical protein